LTISTSDTDGVICLDGGLISLISDQNGTVFSGSGVIGSSFDPLAAGIGLHVISASYTDGIGCMANESLSLVVEDCAALTELSASGVQVFPNPNQGSFTLKGLDVGTTFQVYDLNGKIIYEGMSLATIEHIQLPKITSGIYYLQTTKSGLVGQLKFAVLN
jgi:hypothetical protein